MRPGSGWQPRERASLGRFAAGRPRLAVGVPRGPPGVRCGSGANFRRARVRPGPRASASRPMPLPPHRRSPSRCARCSGNGRARGRTARRRAAPTSGCRPARTAAPRGRCSRARCIPAERSRVQEPHCPAGRSPPKPSLVVLGAARGPDSVTARRSRPPPGRPGTKQPIGARPRSLAHGPMAPPGPQTGTPARSDSTARPTPPAGRSNARRPGQPTGIPGACGCRSALGSWQPPAGRPWKNPPTARPPGPRPDTPASARGSRSPPSASRPSLKPNSLAARPPGPHRGSSQIRASAEAAPRAAPRPALRAAQGTGPVARPTGARRSPGCIPMWPRPGLWGPGSPARQPIRLPPAASLRRVRRQASQIGGMPGMTAGILAAPAIGCRDVARPSDDLPSERTWFSHAGATDRGNLDRPSTSRPRGHTRVPRTVCASVGVSATGWGSLRHRCERARLRST